MQREKVIQTVKEFLSAKTHISISNISLESKIIDDLGMDSLQVVELAYEVEEKFGIDLPNAELQKIRQVKDAVELVLSRMEDKK